jgi:carbon starvation protein
MHAWKAIWPVFGAANLLLAGLVLLVIAVWLKKTGKKSTFVLIPMSFMNIMTIWALVLLLFHYKFSLIGIIAGVLLLLAIVLIFEACRIFKKFIIS